MFTCTNLTCLPLLFKQLPPPRQKGYVYLVNTAVFLLFLFLKEQNPSETFSSGKISPCTWHSVEAKVWDTNTIKEKDFLGGVGARVCSYYTLPGPIPILQTEIAAKYPVVTTVGTPALKWLPEMTPPAERSVCESPAAAGGGRKHVGPPTRPARGRLERPAGHHHQVFRIPVNCDCADLYTCLTITDEDMLE